MFVCGSIALYCMEVILLYIRSITMKSTGLAVGNRISAKYVNKLFRAPKSWLDDKPIGQVLDRAIKHQNRVDHDIIWGLNWFLSLFVSFTLSLMMVIEQTPINVLVIVLMFIIFYKLNTLVKKSSDKMMQFLNQ